MKFAVVSVLVVASAEVIDQEEDNVMLQVGNHPKHTATAVEPDLIQVQEQEEEHAHSNGLSGYCKDDRDDCAEVHTNGDWNLNWRRFCHSYGYGSPNWFATKCKAFCLEYCAGPGNGCDSWSTYNGVPENLHEQCPKGIEGQGPPQDCQLADEWTKKSSCSRTCGGGTQREEKKVVQQAANGGAECRYGDRFRTVQCNTDACPPVNCQLSDWRKDGVCSATCGGGKQKWVKVESPKASHGGEECSEPEEARHKEEDCNTQECPICNNLEMKTKTGRWGGEMSWIINGECKVQATGDSGWNGRGPATITCCLEDDTYVVNCKDAYGDGWNGGYLTIAGKEICKSFTRGSSYNQGFEVEGGVVSVTKPRPAPRPQYSYNGYGYR